MALVIGVQETKEVSKWVDYKDENGEVLARFQIKGIKDKKYEVARERASNQVASKGFDVASALSTDKTYPELLKDAVACHLIADWEGIEIVIDGKATQPPYTPEAGMLVLSNESTKGAELWLWVISQAERIQEEQDEFKNEILGKSESSTTTSADTQDSASTK